MSGRMDWEGAARKARVRTQGGEPAQRQVVTPSKCKHAWTDWHPAGAFDPKWRRDCKTCGRIQVRNKPPATTKSRAPSRRGQAAVRTKGDLLIRRADGTTETIPGKDASTQARTTISKKRA